MGKKVAILGSVMVVIAILASTVLASSGIKLFVNNEEIKPDSPPLHIFAPGGEEFWVE